MIGAVTEVRLINDSGLAWSDLITPGLTFVGALMGVLIGGLITRRNLFDVEDRRASKERDMQQWRRDREDESQRRQTRGIARALKVEVEERRILLALSIDNRMWWPPGRVAAFTVTVEERTLLAVWFGDRSWELLAVAFHQLAALDHEYPPVSKDTFLYENMLGADPAKFEPALEAVQDAVSILDLEVARLGESNAATAVSA